MKKTSLQLKPLALAIATLGATFANPAAAVKFEMENGITGSFDSTISFGAQMRMQSPDKSIIGNDNGGNVPTVGDPRIHGATGYANPDFNYLNTDDGNLNYNKHDVVSAVFKGTHELFLTQKGNWSALGRFTWSTDLRADNTRRTPLDDDAEDAMEKNISLLDLWVSKQFQLGDNAAKLKFGNQVISWGEDIFIIGGINAVNALDLRKIHIPGVQVKEVFIPAPMISFSSGLGNGFSTEAYYQFRWNSFKFDPAGTYWSSADFLGKGGKRGAFIPVLRLWPPSAFGDFDQARRHDAARHPGGRRLVIPVEQTSRRWRTVRAEPALQAGGGRYRICRLLHPLSRQDSLRRLQTLECCFPACALGSPTSWRGCDRAVRRRQEPLRRLAEYQAGRLGDRCRDSRTARATAWPLIRQAFHLPGLTRPAGGSRSHLRRASRRVKRLCQREEMPGPCDRFLPAAAIDHGSLGAAEGAFLGEVAVTHYPNLDLSGAVPYLLNNYTLPDKTSWGYVAEVSLTYANIFQSGWTLTPVLDFYHDVNGTSPTALPFVEGRKAVALNFNFDYHNEWKAGVGYTTFWGGGNMNMLRDRDVLTISVSKIF
ncbi:MAG: DUF1302 family protein [Sulfuritalea sp.]|nr:DUF1302 family protein [Sulfuritalea sp.]